MSKGIRRLLSLVFAAALLLGLALPACAEGSISAIDVEELPDWEIEETGSISGAESDDAAQESVPAPAEREIYVSADGDDMADGSREHPLASLAAASLVSFVLYTCQNISIS